MPFDGARTYDSSIDMDLHTIGLSKVSTSRCLFQTLKKQLDDCTRETRSEHILPGDLSAPANECLG